MKFVSPLGNYIFSFSKDGDLRQWNTEDCSLVHDYGKLEGTVTGYNFSPDNKNFFIGTSDGFLRQFSITERVEV